MSDLDDAAREIRAAQNRAIRTLLAVGAYLQALGQQGDALAAELARQVDEALDGVTLAHINGATALHENDTEN